VKRLIPLLLGVLVVAACGVRPSGVISGGDPPSGSTTGTVVFFLSDHLLAPATRETVSPDEALAQLAAGPTERERAQGLRTELPTEITLRTDPSPPTPTIVATVNPQTLTPLAVDQIVCTATATELTTDGGITITGQGATLQPKYCGY
jgi:hypothetical protein